MAAATRRDTLATLACFLAVPTSAGPAIAQPANPAVAAPSLAALADPPTDTALIAACNEAIRINAETCRRAFVEDWSDDQMDAAGRAYSDQVAAALALPAIGREGLAAKARLVSVEFQPEAFGAEPSQRDHLLFSLLRDLAGAAVGGRP